MPLQLFPCSLRQLELPHSSEALLQLLHSINDLRIAVDIEIPAGGRSVKEKDDIILISIRRVIFEVEYIVEKHQKTVEDLLQKRCGRADQVDDCNAGALGDTGKMTNKIIFDKWPRRGFQGCVCAGLSCGSDNSMLYLRRWR